MERRSIILAVDDEPFNIELIVASLGDEYEILTALCAQDAITLLREQTPDLILMDVMMPDMNGFDLCKIIKADKMCTDIPIIFLTFLDTREAASEGLELGGIEYLSKPIDFSLLRLRIRNHIALKNNIELVKAQRDLLAQQKLELEAILARVMQLEGIIPICSYCKKIRDDQNSWQPLEKYISEHSEARFSHGACPDCYDEQIAMIRTIGGKHADRQS